MTPGEEQLLRSVVERMDLPQKVAANPLDNSYWENLIRGAEKALATVSTYSMDWKLTAITKLLQSWLADKEAEQRAQQQFNAGYNFELASLDAWDGRTYD